MLILIVVLEKLTGKHALMFVFILFNIEISTGNFLKNNESERGAKKQLDNRQRSELIYAASNIPCIWTVCLCFA